MKAIWKELMICAVMGLALPGAMMKLSTGFSRPGELQAVMVTEGPSETVPETAAAKAPGPQIPVLWTDGSLRQMDLEEYLVGVVLAEMPAEFEEEALKAQAVAARTYAGKAHLLGGKHGNGSICTDSSCCQAYLSEAGYLQKGGTQASLEKVRAAVEATAGLVLTYDGELIEATYFSCSGGSTEDAQAVWGADFPYLRAVDSPGEENSRFFREKTVLEKSRVETLLGITLPENPSQWLGEVKRTPGNGVASMEIGGQMFKGTELRTLLGLRSTAFTATADDRGLILETLGYGHRVGMSQYGADAMAVQGKTFEEILSHYYPGTELSPYPTEKNELFTEDSQADIAN